MTRWKSEWIKCSLFSCKIEGLQKFFTTARNWSVKYKSEFFGLFPRFYSWKAKTFKAAITSSHFSWNFLKEIQTKINQKETKFIKLLPDFFHSTLKSSKWIPYNQAIPYSSKNSKILKNSVKRLRSDRPKTS